MPEDRGRGVVDRGAAGRRPAGAVPAAGERRVSACGCDCHARQDDTRWLAMLLRQGLKLIIAGIDARYGESRADRERREHQQSRAA